MTFSRPGSRSQEDSHSLALRRVLPATDLSPTSALATDWAFDLARRNDAGLLGRKCHRPAGARARRRGLSRAGRQVRERREAAAQHLVGRGRQAGVPVTILVWAGDPGESIVAAAESEGVDMILVGAHSRGVLRRLLMGSVSE